VVTRTPFASSAPAGFRRVAVTPQYELWARTGPVPPRGVLQEAGRPGALLDCTTPDGRALSRRRGAAHVIPQPVVSGPLGWSHVVRDAGDSATQSLRLPRGRWDLSLQYVSRQPVTVAAAGVRTVLPGTLARMGPYYITGTVTSDGRTPVTVRVRLGSLPSFGRLIGSKGTTRALDSLNHQPLGALAATRHGAAGATVPLRRACGRYVDWYRVGG